jgi:hypothetical protein
LFADGAVVGVVVVVVVAVNVVDAEEFISLGLIALMNEVLNRFPPFGEAASGFVAGVDRFKKDPEEVVGAEGGEAMDEERCVVAAAVWGSDAIEETWCVFHLPTLCTSTLHSPQNTCLHCSQFLVAVASSHRLHFVVVVGLSLLIFCAEGGVVGVFVSFGVGNCLEEIVFEG